MKFLLVTIVFCVIASNSVFGSEAKCISHGDCQILAPAEEIACFKVVTGIDSVRAKTCRVECAVVLITQYCKKESGNLFGICESEDFKMQDFNPNDPDFCSDALRK